MMRHWFLIVLSIGNLYSTADGANEFVERQDLKDKISSLACNPNSPHLQQIWEQGVFDAQISFERITSSEAQSDSKLRLLAQKKARMAGHQAIVFGSCLGKSNAYWVASLPATTALANQDEAITIPVANMRQHCLRIAVDFAAHGVSRPRVLQIAHTKELKDTLTVQRRYLSSGVVGVTCIPRAETLHGQQLWYLIPIASLPDATPPEAALLNGPDINHSLLQWVNALREKLSLPRLNAAGSQHQVARRILTQAHLHHDRRALAAASRDLRQHGFKIVGENRVHGNDRQSLAWFLWNSPQHRRLLLNPSATHLSVTTAADDQGLYAILLLTQSKSITPKPE